MLENPSKEEASVLLTVYTISLLLSLVEIPVIIAQLLLSMSINIFFFFPLFLHDWFNIVYVSLFCYCFYIHKRAKNGTFHVRTNKWLLFGILFLFLNFIYLLVVFIFYNIILGGPSLSFSPGQEHLVYPTAFITISIIIVIVIKSFAYYLATIRTLPTYEQNIGFFGGKISEKLRRAGNLYIIASFVNILTLCLYFLSIYLEIDFLNSGGNLAIGPREYLLATGLPYLLLSFVLLIPLVTILILYQALSYWQISKSID